MVVLLYGELPEPFYLLRLPDKGVRWRTLMQAVKRLVKKLTATPRHRAAPYWYIDGTWHPRNANQWHCYEYSSESGEFEKVQFNS